MLVPEDPRSKKDHILQGLKMGCAADALRSGKSLGWTESYPRSPFEIKGDRGY